MFLGARGGLYCLLWNIGNTHIWSYIQPIFCDKMTSFPPDSFFQSPKDLSDKYACHIKEEDGFQVIINWKIIDKFKTSLWPQLTESASPDYFKQLSNWPHLLIYRKFYFLFTHMAPIVKRTIQASCCLCLTSCQNGLLLSFKDTILENQPAVLEASSLQGYISWNAFQQISGEPKDCSLEIQGCIPAIVLPLFTQDLQQHHLWFTAAKAALTFTSQISSPLFARISRVSTLLVSSGSITGAHVDEQYSLRSHCILDPRPRQARNLPRWQFTWADRGSLSPTAGCLPQLSLTWPWCSC